MTAKGTRKLARWAVVTLMWVAAPAGATPTQAAKDSGSVQAHPRTIVIGFLGGYVSRNSAIRSEVKLAKRLRSEYPDTARVETFENRRQDAAYQEILKLLGAKSGRLSDEQKRQARIVIYGHSWGGCATVELARRLEKEGIPVLLTVQVDSVSHWWTNDSVIPANVEKAINFYQSAGLLHGRREIRAADAAHTQILGNKGYDYRKNPVKCEGYPIWDRWFAKTHMEIECDPSVWGQVESLIRAELGPAPEQTASK